MTARRHHFISECYLKGFSSERRKGERQVHVFDRETKNIFTTSIGNVGNVRDFNRIDVEGHKPDEFESQLSQFEGLLAPALLETGAARKFRTDRERAIILEYMSLLAMRNPYRREWMRTMHEDVLKRMVGLSLQTKERWEKQQERAYAQKGEKPPDNVTYEQMKEFFEKDEYKITLRNEYNISMELKAANGILQTLAARKWIFLCASRQSGGFITSDDPVALMWGNPAERGQFYSPGFGLKGTQVIFPLSSRIALAGAFEIDDRTIEVGENQVAAVNGCLAMSATRQVYARDLNFTYVIRNGAPLHKADRLIKDEDFLGVKKPTK